MNHYILAWFLVVTPVSVAVAYIFSWMVKDMGWENTLMCWLTILLITGGILSFIIGAQMIVDSHCK